MSPALKRMVWLLNSAGFAFYLAWLATMGDRQILREQDGIVYFLPVIPFFFVYMLLLEPKPKPQAPKETPPAPPTSDPSRPPASPPP
ncbi:MAG: hypothetical protein PHO14_05380 [Kiritimatiellae bacterium]|nr:hypothetical protein [Kiritimatiellia bacterium]MDD4341649.1 hypothetical protein [Kiritimatiellia bacterium]MDY0149938.1 hypothetical protein [Kiritimatiellia bacterium]